MDDEQDDGMIDDIARIKSRMQDIRTDSPHDKKRGKSRASRNRKSRLRKNRRQESV